MANCYTGTHPALVLGQCPDPYNKPCLELAMITTCGNTGRDRARDLAQRYPDRIAMLAHNYEGRPDDGPLKVLQVMADDGFEVKPDSLIDVGHRFRVRCDYPMMAVGHVCPDSRKRVGDMIANDRLNVSRQLAMPRRTDEDDMRRNAALKNGYGYSGSRYGRTSSRYDDHAPSTRYGGASSRGTRSDRSFSMDSRAGARAGASRFSAADKMTAMPTPQRPRKRRRSSSRGHAFEDRRMGRGKRRSS